MRRSRIVFVICTGLFVALGCLMAVAWWRVNRCATLTYRTTSELAQTKVALVLGCSPRLGNGDQNWFFNNRIKAAAELFESGKVEYLLVSGDNHRRGYDEPTDMKNALIRLGVPEDRIVCDYAGFTTLESVVRAKKVFGQSAVTIVSQRFHNIRAIYLAQACGLRATGYDAADIAMRYALKTYLREVFSRGRAWLDVNITHRQPRFLGEPVRIGDH